MENGNNGLVQPDGFGREHAVCPSPRIEARAPERFGRINVAEAGDPGLVEQQEF